ncbi:MAG TPA: hydroxymethylbilane synthase [Candidatus Acidoferrales bacterium]|nr:hydroxymethylbilane synthase [Candidatus Acidoferrales bacterium]
MATTRIGTRASALARWQANEVARLWRDAHPDATLEIVPLSSPGDEQPDAPLERMEGTGFFTSTLERALRSRAIDVAVHSYKDLPVEASAGLVVAAVPPRGPVEDALCARDRMTLDSLPRGARVGTSSRRRIAQLRALRPDLALVPLRGNVPTRLERVARGELDAVVLARAGVERLGLGERIIEIFPTARLLTAPAQGALAVQARADDAGRLAALAALDDAATRRAADAERAVLHALRGGCSVPVGAFARLEGALVRIDAGVFALSGTRALRVTRDGADAAAVGTAAAQGLLAEGAAEILSELEREARVAWEPRS